MQLLMTRREKKPITTEESEQVECEINDGMITIRMQDSVVH